MRHRSFRLAAAFVLTVATGACGSDSSVAPLETQPATLPEIFAELSVAGMAGKLAPIAGLDGAAPLSGFATWDCAFTAAAQSFVCPTQTVEGYTVSQSYALLDAAGTPQSAFDPTRTAAVRAKSAVAGTQTGQGGSLTIDAQQELTLSGLLTGTHTLNGTATLHATGTAIYAGVSSPVDVNAKTTIANLVLPPKSSSTSWPTSGTITVESVSALGSGLPSGTSKVAMTFNGTSRVNVVVSLGNITVSCSVDLAKSEATSCS
jgi:hypothetical protein